MESTNWLECGPKMEPIKVTLEGTKTRYDPSPECRAFIKERDEATVTTAEQMRDRAEVDIRASILSMAGALRSDMSSSDFQHSPPPGWPTDEHFAKTMGRLVERDPARAAVACLQYGTKVEPDRPWQHVVVKTIARAFELGALPTVACAANALGESALLNTRHAWHNLPREVQEAKSYDIVLTDGAGGPFAKTVLEANLDAAKRNGDKVAQADVLYLMATTGRVPGATWERKRWLEEARALLFIPFTDNYSIPIGVRYAAVLQALDRIVAEEEMFNASYAAQRREFEEFKELSQVHPE